MGIIDIQLAGLQKRMADKHIAINVTKRAKELLVNEGYDPVYGARPLKRAIQKLVLDQLAIKVLEGEFKENDTVHVDAVDGKIVFKKKG